MGIEIELFTLQQIAIHYQCIVCKDVPDVNGDKVLRVMCHNGHIVCLACIETKHGRMLPTKCYLCNVPLGGEMYTAQPAIERLIKDLEVMCSKHAEGCPWKGKCGDLRTHEKDKCEYRIETCKHSARGCPVSDSPPKVALHTLTSEWRDVTCPRKVGWTHVPCGVVHRANRVDTHRANDCIHHCCLYWKSGCRFSGNLAAVTAHQTSYCAPLHAKLAKLKATIASDTLISEQTRILREVEERVSNYKKRIQELTDSLEASDSRVSILQAQHTGEQPHLISQGTLLPKAADGSAAEPALVDIGPGILIRVCPPKKRCRCHLGDHDDETSQEAWGDVNWTDADWQEVDRQVLKAHTKKQSALAGATNRKTSEAAGKRVKL